MRRGYARARTVTETMLQRATEQGEAEEAVALASLLVLQSPDAAWEVVWPAIEQDVDFGRKLVERLAVSMERNGQLVGSKLTEAKLASLLAWLLRQFPDRDGERPHRFHKVTIEEDVAWFRNAIQDQLRDRATPGALQELQRIAQEFPEWNWDADLLLATELVVNPKNWTEPKSTFGLYCSRGGGSHGQVPHL